MRKIVLTVDLENDWETEETEAIEKVLPEFLDFLRDNKAKATFFVVGEIAEKFPEQIKRIIKQGYEIASHSQTHKNLKSLSFGEIEKEVSKSKQVLEKLGAEVSGFRTSRGTVPFEIYDILKNYNYRYSSSVISSWFPGRYSELKSSQIKRMENGIIELPVPNFSKLKIPAGLSYNRLFYPTLKNSFANEPYMIYLHLHEFLKKPMGRNIPLHVRAASLRNRGHKAWKIFKEFANNSNAKFITCNDYLRYQKTL